MKISAKNIFSIDHSIGKVFSDFFVKQKTEIKDKPKQIILKNDDSLERISIMRHIIDFFWIPFLNSIPEKFGDRFLRKSSEDANSTKNFATTYKALEIFYKFDGSLVFKKEIKNYFYRLIDAIFTWIWQNVHHVQSTRNRIRIIKNELKKIINDLQSKGKQDQMIIASLGAGSARGVLETTKELNGDGINTKIVLFDKSQEALDYSRQLSEELNIGNKIEYNLGKVEDLDKFYEHNGTFPDVVEMVGLGDYFDDPKLLEFFKIIFNNLKPGGFFIVSNVIPHRERPFIEKIINWKGMRYRKPEDFYNLVLHAGFKDSNTRLIIEPVKIHAIIIAQKIT